MSFRFKLKRLPILKRLIPSLFKLWRRNRPGYVMVSRGGLLWLLYPRSIVDREMILWGDWEPEQRSLLLRRMTQDGADMFLDVGSCFGLYAITIKHRMPGLDVHAFEPHPANRAQLQANILINNLTGRITVHDCAASATAQRMTIAFADEKNRGAATVNGEGAMSFDIAARPLDDLFPIKSKTIFAKIDVEGHEKEVLAGAKNLIAGNRCFFQIECLQSGDTAGFLSCAAEMNLRVAAQIDEDYFRTNF